MREHVLRIHRKSVWQLHGRMRAPVLAALLFAIVPGVRITAQSSASLPQPKPVPDWVTVAGGHQEFDVVSIHEDKNANDPSRVNVPYGPEDTYTDTHGVFSATNWPVDTLIIFAFKNIGLSDVFHASLPGWTFTDRFNIEARTDKQNVTKDQMRLMVRSMLVDRFHLKAHYESRTVSAYAAELVKPGVLGPQLRPHPADDSCSGANATVISHMPSGSETDVQPAASNAKPEPYPTLPGGFPLRCGTYVRMPPSHPYLRHEGGRNLTMAQIVHTFDGMSNLGRPVVDRTGLTGTYDWVMEFIDERYGPLVPPDAEGLTFLEALKKQCGLKLEPTKAPFDVLIVDHLDRPTAN